MFLLHAQYWHQPVNGEANVNAMKLMTTVLLGVLSTAGIAQQ